MKALICPSLGPAENLRVAEVEEPAPGEGEVLVEVAYAGLNFFDTLIIEGKYQVRPEPPFSPGGEFSGRVAALGAGSERVCGRRPGHGLLRLWRGRRADRGPHGPAGANPRWARARQGGGPFGRLRHDACTRSSSAPR